MTGLLNRRRGSHQFLCGLLAALMAAGPSASFAQEPQPGPATPADAAAETPEPKPRVNNDKTLLADPAAEAKEQTNLDVAYTLPNACVVAVIRPAQILNSPAAELFPTEVLQAAAVKEVGLDPLTAEQVVVSVAPPLGGPPSYTVYARFNQKIELKPSAITEHTRAAELKGKEYFQSPELMLPSFYAVDDASLLAAPDFTLLQLINRETAPEVGPLAADVAAASKGDDLLVMVDVESLRPLINMGLAQAQLPWEAESIRLFPMLIKQVELRMNITGAGVTELVATANDEAAAEQVVAVFDGLKQAFADKMAEEVRRSLASDDPVEQAQGRYSQRMIKYWDAQLQLVREGDRLVLLRHDLASDPTSQLTYIATIGVLIGLLLPAVQAAREAARRNHSANNMKRIILGLINYEAARREFPAWASFDKDGKPLLSWRVHILPFIEMPELYARFRLDEPWDSEHNKQLIPLMPECFLDPSSRLNLAEGKTHYLGVKGEGYFFPEKTPLTMEHLQGKGDGATNTVAIVQVNDEQATTWTKPGDWEPDPKDPLKGLGGLHPGVFLAAFCAGQVRFISQTINPDTWKALLTTHGKERVNHDDF